MKLLQRTANYYNNCNVYLDEFENNNNIDIKLIEKKAIDYSEKIERFK